VLGRNREQLKAIRRGEWTEAQVRDHFTRSEPRLEQLYQDSKLPHGPDETAIKALLMECLEEHFGSLAAVAMDESRPLAVLREVDAALDRVRELL
jgi:hypothetical protein